MPAKKYHLIDAFSLRNIDGGMIIYPPGEASVRASSRGVTMTVNSYDPVCIGTAEIDRLVAAGIAIPQ